MLSAGIVDPAKVVRVALQDAASIAGLVVSGQILGCSGCVSLGA